MSTDPTPAGPVVSVPDTDVPAGALGKPCTCTMETRTGIVLDRESDCGIHGAAVVALAVAGWTRAGGSWPDSISGRHVIMGAVDAGRAPLLAENVEIRRLFARYVRELHAAHLDIERLTAELAEARAAALPEGGEWRTVRGWMNGDKFQTYTSSAEGFLPATGPTHRQRIWTGPVEPVTETETTDGAG